VRGHTPMLADPRPPCKLGAQLAEPVALGVTAGTQECRMRKVCPEVM
jgi:hypothetical protein